MDISSIKAPRLDAKILKAVDLVLEKFYPEASKAGDSIAKSGMKNNQVRGLETLIVSTTRFSEIINYVKNQVGKERKGNEWQTVGPVLLEQLSSLENKAAEIAGEDPVMRLEVKLRLARGWARQVVAHYLYSSNLTDKEKQA